MRMWAAPAKKRILLCVALALALAWLRMQALWKEGAVFSARGVGNVVTDTLRVLHVRQEGLPLPFP